LEQSGTDSFLSLKYVKNWNLWFSESEPGLGEKTQNQPFSGCEITAEDWSVLSVHVCNNLLSGGSLLLRRTSGSGSNNRNLE
jgi:hypothetical protein